MSWEGAKKLVFVLTTSTLVTKDSEQAIFVDAKELEQVTCIRYLIAFPGNLTQDSLVLNSMLALLDSGSEINVMHLAFAKMLSLVMQTTNVGAQKIDSTTLETYRMVVAVFLVIDQADRVRFFEETFLAADISLDMILRIFFLTLSDIDVSFPKKKLW